jgi:hypothetical protein
MDDVVYQTYEDGTMKAGARNGIGCTASPLLQAWAMMQGWGVTKQPRWYKRHLGQVNQALRDALNPYNEVFPRA